MSMLQSKEYSIEERIYDFADGQIDENLLPENIRGKVKNEMEVGSRCESLYNEIYAAEVRILNRLGVDESEELDIIMQNHSTIAKILGLRMYSYGAEFGKDKKIMPIGKV